MHTFAAEAHFTRFRSKRFREAKSTEAMSS
jgi:hypothetical protein